MRYWIGFVLLPALMALPLSASGREGTEAKVLHRGRVATQICQSRRLGYACNWTKRVRKLSRP
jgi:hypothetical protein